MKSVLNGAPCAPPRPDRVQPLPHPSGWYPVAATFRRSRDDLFSSGPVELVRARSLPRRRNLCSRRKHGPAAGPAQEIRGPQLSDCGRLEALAREALRSALRPQGRSSRHGYRRRMVDGTRQREAHLRLSRLPGHRDHHLRRCFPLRRLDLRTDDPGDHPQSVRQSHG